MVYVYNNIYKNNAILPLNESNSFRHNFRENLKGIGGENKRIWFLNREQKHNFPKNTRKTWFHLRSILMGIF